MQLVLTPTHSFLLRSLNSGPEGSEVQILSPTNTFNNLQSWLPAGAPIGR